MSASPRVLGYIRRSTDKQDISPEVQAARLEESAAVLGWALELRYEEAASAKSLEGRPVLAAALADLKAGRAHTLAVAKLDRLSRDVEDFAGLLKLAERQGWALVCLDLGVDTSTITGRAMAHVTAAFAEMERRRIGERTREGMARIRATQGKHMGRPSLIPAEVEERIAALHTDGKSASAIAELLEREGVARPTARSKSWHHSHVTAAVRRVEVRRTAA
ncbi:recombinase family protein [Terrabacter terrigena]|uniref:Recombinase family protein n=1 Tax=Terrabacter terrigena TaxID=574718 RepID=A0ABW3MZH8_9MICO